MIGGIVQHYDVHINEGLFTNREMVLPNSQWKGGWTRLLPILPNNFDCNNRRSSWSIHWLMSSLSQAVVLRSSTISGSKPSKSRPFIIIFLILSLLHPNADTPRWLGSESYPFTRWKTEKCKDNFINSFNVVNKRIHSRSWTPPSGVRLHTKKAICSNMTKKNSSWNVKDLGCNWTNTVR